MCNLTFKCFCIILFNIIYLKYSNSATGANHGKVVVCYLATWAVYRQGRGSFAIENLDPSLCTNIVYAFVGYNITDDSIYSIDAWQDLVEDFGNGGFNRIIALKDNNPQLKVTVAIGGWNEGSKKYSILASDPERRQKFVANAVKYVRQHKFDGLDMVWQSPGKRGGSPNDKQNFVLLIKELRIAFNKYNLILTAMIAGQKDAIDLGYDVNRLSDYLDYVHLMSYDYHGDWDGETGANAPLRSNDEHNVEYSVKYMISLGMDPSKLVLGIPLYGRTFYLTDKAARNSNVDKPKLGLMATETGFEGPYSEETGFMGYNEVCIELQNNSMGWSKHWDEVSQTPFAVNNDKVIVYDDESSITLKVNLAMKEKLAGVMVWTIDTDDFQGDCKWESKENNQNLSTNFPLMQIINKAIINSLLGIEASENVIRKATTYLFVCPAIFVWCN